MYRLNYCWAHMMIATTDNDDNSGCQWVIKSMENPQHQTKELYPDRLPVRDDSNAYFWALSAEQERKKKTARRMCHRMIRWSYRNIVAAIEFTGARCSILQWSLFAVNILSAINLHEYTYAPNCANETKKERNNSQMRTNLKMRLIPPLIIIKFWRSKHIV